MATAAKKHYRLSPSAAHRWLICPGEPKLRASVPNQSSSYAEEGTTAHWVGEQCLITGREPRSYAGSKCPETGMVVSAEMTQAVKFYTDECHRVKGSWHQVESEVTLSDISEDLGGTLDFCSVVNDVALNIRDYKHGQGYGVDVNNNPQLLIYALGALREVGKRRPDLVTKVKGVLLGIVQPRLGDGEPVKLAKLLLSELIEWKETVLKPAVQRVEDEPDTLVAGDHCRFCPAKAVCPAQYDKNLAIAAIDFAKPVAVAPPAPASMTIDQLARVLQAKDQIESWLGAIEEHAQAMLQSGKPVPGFKLVKKRSNRAWKDEKVAEAALTKLVGQGAYAPRKLLSPTQAEETLKVFGVELSADLVVKPDNGNVIAPMSDKRHAVLTLPAAADFLQDADFLS